jgi:hypothetical protein
MSYRLLLLGVLTALLWSCDQDAGVANMMVGSEGRIDVPIELGGRIRAVEDKSRYDPMAEAPDPADLGPSTSFSNKPWFILVSGDRVRLVELDVEQQIGRVESLSGLSAGQIGWVPLGSVKSN